MRSKWFEFKVIENWVLVNKGPIHDLATVMALMKMLCMKAQKCPNFAEIDDMVNSRNLGNIAKFTKVVHMKLKTQNVFLDSTHKGLGKRLLKLFLKI